MSMHVVEYAKAHMVEQIMHLAGVSPVLAPRFRRYLEQSPLTRLRQIMRKIYGDD